MTKCRVTIEENEYQRQQEALDIQAELLTQRAKDIDAERVNEKLKDTNIMWEATGPDAMPFAIYADGQVIRQKERENQDRFERALSEAIINDECEKVGQMIVSMAKSYLSDFDAAMEKAVELDNEGAYR